MQLTMLHSKIHRATVTMADLHYEGSISIDQNLLEQSKILEFEQVDVYNITAGSRFTTYTISAPAGSGTIQVNGAAARLVQKGDLVIIACYRQFSELEAKLHKPKVILVDPHNKAIS